jgi:DNA transposition AAA+ family ATPase
MTLVLIYGGAGVSKTTTAKRYQHENTPGAYYVSLHGLKSPTAMLREIAAHVYPPALADSYRNRAIERALADHLMPGDLLLLDECQSLRADALDTTRFFLDEAGVGLVLMGNERVFSTIAGDKSSAMFGPMHSRIGMRLRIPCPTEADVDAVLKSFGVSDGAAREYGRHLGTGPLGLRGMVRILRQARIAAKNRALDHRIMYGTAKALGLDN